MRRSSALAFVFLLAVAGCSPGGSSATSTTAPAVTTTEPAPTTTIRMSTTTLAPETTTSGVAPTTTTTTRQIDVFVEGGQVIGLDRFTYQLGEEVSVWLLSDIADEVHVHGYDIFFLVKPGIPAEIAFIADIPGIFEVEMESSHLLLFELEVSP